MNDEPINLHPANGTERCLACHQDIDDWYVQVSEHNNICYVACLGCAALIESGAGVVR